MKIEQQLYAAAAELIYLRYPNGWGGAAAVRTESGKILTSVAPDIKVASLGLCMEVGAFLEAHKLNEVVTHSLCIAREDENSELRVLSPCGVCRERLAHWGGDVLAAISTSNHALTFKTLRELMPDHWSIAFDEKL